MKKKNKNVSAQQSNNGFDNLIGVHTAALEENSEAIAKMLEILASKKLSNSNKKELSFIKRELKRLNKDLDNLGED